MALQTTTPEWQIRTIIIIAVLFILLHTIQTALVLSRPSTESPSILSVITGAFAWITFTDMGMPMWALWPFEVVNIIIFFTIAWLVYINFKDTIANIPLIGKLFGN
jgi:hypothetical protein